MCPEAISLVPWSRRIGLTSALRCMGASGPWLLAFLSGHYYFWYIPLRSRLCRIFKGRRTVEENVFHCCLHEKEAHFSDPLYFLETLGWHAQDVEGLSVVSALLWVFLTARMNEMRISDKRRKGKYKTEGKSYL